MKYFSREEVERIGVAGSCALVEDGRTAFRYLSSFWLYVEPGDEAFTPHGPSGYWEAWITKWVSQEFDSHDIFLDVGANVGYYSMMAANHGLKVIAIEPNANVARMISDSAKLNNFSDVEVVIEALYDSDGMMSLEVPDRHSGGAFLTNSGSAAVKTSKLDTRYHFTNNQRVLMKVDAEGAEPKIWAGMTETLERTHLTAFLEWDSSRYNAEEFSKELFKQPYVGLIEWDGSERRFIHPSQVESLDGLQTVIVRNYEFEG